MECLKDCCKKLTKKREKEQEETKGVAVQVPVTRKRLGVQEDYLLSKMPPDGKEVPFVLPTLKASYVQPGASSSPNLQYGMPGPTRCAYAQRKAELLNPLAASFAYSSESSLHTVAVAADPERTSFGLNSRDLEVNTSYSDSGERLSRSMTELITTHSPEMKSFDSMPSVLSTSASISDSMRSSADSFSLLGDDLGKLCVRLSYKEEMEQVWITLVQCSQLNLPVNKAQKPKIRIKGVITLPKPVKFQTSIKEYCRDTSFTETFVFALSLQSLRGSALLLKLQTQGAKKRTVAKCVLSLRPLGPQEIEQWLPLRSPCKFSGRGCELHLATCFQPVCRRLQVRVLAAQNLPTSASPLPPAYAVTVEMLGSAEPATKKKTRALKATKGQCQWNDTFHLELDPLELAACELSIKLFSCSSVKRKHCVGQVQLGLNGPTQEAAEQWKDTVDHPEKVVAAWHTVT
ncbi:tandem C2 domains nuclear protein [Hippocampus comes]|uniref:tandem C2 domains nuclear protein n=1 Tax=Hippocampus comes TaxID=109280 RepID=UPI00094E9B3D|nr:PREDICTED: tandem C2 domains nuclear protein [Hippocampus comes]